MREPLTNVSAYKEQDYNTKDIVTRGNAKTMEILSNPSNQGYCLAASVQNDTIMENPTLNHPGPKPNPSGQSLIQKMNNLMSQKHSSKFSDLNSR